MSQSSPTAAAPPRPSIGGMLPVIILFAVIGLFVIMGPGNAWNTLFINPLINLLLLLTNLVGGQFGIAIILFTVLLRLATIPFTIRQFRATKSMQEMQPRMQEIQKKYKDPKRRQEEMLKLYREIGFNPLGCVAPMAIQMVVFFALWRALVFVVGGSPESLVGLSQRIYPWDYLTQSIPLEQSLLWLELGRADNTFILPLLVGVSTYLQSRLMQTPATTPQQRQQQQMMTWMLPLLMVWITLSLPSGVGVYWVVSNLFSIVAGYWVYGQRMTLRSLLPMAAPAPAKHSSERPAQIEQSDVQEEGDAPEPTPSTQRKARSRHGKRRGKRKNRR